MTNKLYPVGSIVKVFSPTTDHYGTLTGAVPLFTVSVGDNKDWNMFCLPVNTDGLLVLGHKGYSVSETKQEIEYQVLYKDKIYWVGAENVKQ